MFAASASNPFQISTMIASSGLRTDVICFRKSSCGSIRKTLSSICFPPSQLFTWLTFHNLVAVTAPQCLLIASQARTTLWLLPNGSKRPSKFLDDQMLARVLNRTPGGRSMQQSTDPVTPKPIASKSCVGCHACLPRIVRLVPTSGLD